MIGLTSEPLQHNVKDTLQTTNNKVACFVAQCEILRDLLRQQVGGRLRAGRPSPP
jgi:hypothetical protein